MFEDRSSYTYRGWNVSFDPPPIPTRVFDWEATHPDYDGAPDGNDSRIAYGASRREVQSAIDEWYADNEECPRDPNLRVLSCFVMLATMAAICAIIAIAASVTYG